MSKVQNGMLKKINVFVVQGRCGTDTMQTTLHLNHKNAYKAMSDEYKSCKADCEKREPGTGISRYQATIVTDGDWYEWAISKFVIKMQNGKAIVVKQ